MVKLGYTAMIHGTTRHKIWYCLVGIVLQYCLQFWTAHSTRILLSCKEEQMQLGKRNERKMPSLLDISSRHRPICSTAYLTRVSSLQRSNDRKEMIRQNFVLNSSVLERESSLWQTGIDGSAALLTLFQMLKRLPSLNTERWHVP
jgi:hypothetical protein